MSFYLDTNFIVAFLTAEPLSERAAAFLAGNPAPLIVSDFAAIEFSAVIARQVRTGERPRNEATVVLAEFDAWCARSVNRARITSDDIILADNYLRRLDLPLLAPDAIHLAAAHGAGATLATYDRSMAAVARALGVPVAAA